jgi:DNA-binding NtrC family response regulator
MATKKLSQEEREFFRLVSCAALSNPFSDERTELDIRIAECPPDASETERLLCLFSKMKERIEKLEKEGRADIGLYSGDDRIMMQSVFLFEIFFIFTKGFDELIERQIKTGESTCFVPFGKEAIALFIKRGFSPDDACRFFAILYQLKRAYYFIDKALIGQSPCMRDLRRHLWNNVFTYDIRLYERFLMNRMEDFSTMILGDTGTGKGTAAAAIGRSGFIPYNPEKNVFNDSFMLSFISINLSLYPESLIESELFGHKKGAFTGAINLHEGIFSRCRPHGSILLDEIGDVSLPVQLKLLQILQERTFSPVGSHEILRFNGRVIAATNKSIKELRGNGLFRSDFYYRLSSDCIVMPSLSARINENPDELRLILNSIIERLTGAKSEELVNLVLTSLEKSPGRDYSWPGNVRELEQATRRILLTREYRGESLETSGGIKEMLKNGIETQTIGSQELISGYCALLYERYGTYEEVARRMNLDRRTVRRYIELYQG